MRRLVIVCVLVVALIPGFALAQEDGETGTISGQVSNGTEDGGDIEGLEVVLTRFEAMEAAEEYTTTVDSDGNYEFEDLPINQGEAYLAQVTYNDIEFNAPMTLLTQEPNAEADITVYEQTEDPEVLQILSRGIVVADADDEAGIIEILEIIALENTSDRVFVGDEDGQVLRLAMPGNAQEISPQAGFDFGQMYFEENVLISTGAVTPGEHNPMITYHVPYEGTSGALTVGTEMPTSTLRVLVRQDSFDLDSEMLQPAGEVQVGQDTYDALAVESPVVGDSFSVEISGLPRENFNLPIDTPTLLASLAAGVGLVIGAVLIYQVVQRRNASTQPATAGAGAGTGDSSVAFDDMSQDELESERLELASELNKLDADYERGDLDEESYTSERDEILAELRNISLRMRGVEE